MNDLDKLIDAVETSVANYDCFYAFMTHPECDHADRAYHGSLDAAKALHEALLDSGFHAEIWACCTRPQVKVARVHEEHIGYDDNPARAWLIATLKAYRSIK